MGCHLPDLISQQGLPVAILTQSLLIKARTDEVWPIVECEEQIRPAPPEGRQAQHRMGQSRGYVGTRREDSQERPKVD